MASTTPRVGLYMPNDDGSEPINVATDLNDNLEKLDNAVGFVPSTSSSPPVTPFDGMATYETDTGRAKFRKAAGGVWNYILTAGASFLSHIILDKAMRIGVGTGSTPSAIFDANVDNVTTYAAMKYKATAEAYPRMQIDNDGIKFGGGAALPEVRMYRAALNAIGFTGNLVVSNDISVTGGTYLSSLNISGDASIGGLVQGDLNVVGNISSTGKGIHKYVRKTTDTARANTVTVTNDPEMFFTVEANKSYFIEVFYLYTALAAADFRVRFNFPTGTSGLRWGLGEAQAGTNRDDTTMRTGVSQFTTEIIYGGQTDTLQVGGQETLVVTIGGTGGVVNMLWAQGTSNATATTLRGNTLIRYVEI